MDKYLKEAIEAYERNIHSGEPFYMDASLLMDIEEHYEKQGMQYEAEHLMRFAEKLHPYNEEIMVVKAYRLKARNKWDEALAVIAEIPNRENRDVQLFLAEWETAGGEPDKAETRIESNLPPDMSMEDYDWYLDLSEIFLDYGFFKRALHYLLLIPQNYTLRKRVDELIADAYYQLQEYDRSVEAFNHLIDADPYDAVSWSQLADIQQKQGKLEDCLGSCEYALAIDDNNQQAINLKLFSLFGLGKFEEGMKFFHESADKIPNDYAIRMYAAEQCYTNRDFSTAIDYFHDSMRLCPLDNADRPRIIYGLAMALAQEGMYDKAEETLLTLCTTGHAPAEVYFQLADMFFETATAMKAARMLNYAFEASPDDDKNNTRIVQMLFNHKCFLEAKDLWIKMADAPLSDEYPAIYTHLSFALHTLKQPEAYLSCLRKALKHSPVLLREVMSVFYGTSDPELILEKAEQEAAGWKENP